MPDVTGLDKQFDYLIPHELSAHIGVGTLALKARRRKIVSGREELVDAAGTVEIVDDGEAWVRVHGESWRARDAAGAQLVPGDGVRVRAIEGLTLIVDRINH